MHWYGTWISCGFKYIDVPTLIISSREYKYWENSPKSVPGNNSYQPSGTDSSPQWASSQGTFFQQAFGTRDPPFSLAIIGMLEAFDTWSMPLKPSKQPKKPNILTSWIVTVHALRLKHTHLEFVKRCANMPVTILPRVNVFAKTKVFEFPGSVSRATFTVTSSNLYKASSLVSSSRTERFARFVFFWFPWADQPPFDTPCQHLDAFRSMFHCHDCSWKNLSVLHPILIEVATFLFFRLSFCQGLHAATANKRQWSKIKVLFSLDSNPFLLSVPLHPDRVHHWCVSRSIAAHCGMPTTSFHSQSPPLEAPQLQ